MKMRLKCGVMPVLKVGVGLLALACAALYAQGPGGGGGRPQQPRPVLLALDVDRDGILSAAEIAAAPKVLLTLDVDGDGQLSSLEYLPKQTDPNAVDPDALVARLMASDKNGDGVLTADELPERLSGMMARLDANHDGRITPDEIRASATKQGGPAGRRQTGAGATRMDPVLNAIDADHDGVLSAVEIANATAALKSLDKNSDGQLTPDELKMRQQTPAERAQHTLDEWDTNKEGKLSKAEAPDRMQEQFEKIDTNGDGFLDLAELTAYNAAQLAQGARPNNEAKQ